MIYVLNGPNLNLLGLREPEIYGSESLRDVESLCRISAEKEGFSSNFFQSNAESALIDFLHQARENAVAIVMNPAAYAHTSVAILDALKCFYGPVAEVHISNIYKRESFRQHSYISSYVDCVIVGCGIRGYQIAIECLIDKLRNSP